RERAVQRVEEITGTGEPVNDLIWRRGCRWEWGQLYFQRRTKRFQDEPLQDRVDCGGGQGLVQLCCRCSVPTLLGSDPAQGQQIGRVITFAGAGFVRQFLEVVASEGRLAFFETTLSASEEEAKAALPHLGMDAVQRLSVGQERERLANGAA